MLETLSNIRLDLENTAAHFESLSQVLAGHLVYASYHVLQGDREGMAANIEGIESAVEALRTAAAKMNTSS